MNNQKTDEKLEQKADKKLKNLQKLNQKVEPNVKTKPEVKKIKPTLIPSIPAGRKKLNLLKLTLKKPLKDSNSQKILRKIKK